MQGDGVGGLQRDSQQEDVVVAATDGLQGDVQDDVVAGVQGEASSIRASTTSGTSEASSIRAATTSASSPSAMVDTGLESGLDTSTSGTSVLPGSQSSSSSKESDAQFTPRTNVS